MTPTETQRSEIARIEEKRTDLRREEEAIGRTLETLVAARRGAITRFRLYDDAGAGNEVESLDARIGEAERQLRNTSEAIVGADQDLSRLKRDLVEAEREERTRAAGDSGRALAEIASEGEEWARAGRRIFERFLEEHRNYSARVRQADIQHGTGDWLPEQAFFAFVRWVLAGEPTVHPQDVMPGFRPGPDPEKPFSSSFPQNLEELHRARLGKERISKSDQEG